MSARHRALRSPIIAVAVAVAALFALLAASYDRGWALDLDARLERSRRGWPGWTRDLGDALDWLGGYWWLPALVAVAVVACWLRGRRRETVLLVVLSAGADGFLHAVKALTDRDRPGEGTTLPAGAAFPSGHTTTAITIYAGLALAAGALLARRASPWPVLAAVAVGVAVGAGRFLDGSRAASDVVGGALLGVVWLGAVLVAGARR